MYFLYFGKEIYSRDGNIKNYKVALFCNIYIFIYFYIYIIYVIYFIFKREGVVADLKILGQPS